MFKEIESRNEFNEIVKEERLTVVDFFANWCGPCRKLSPILEEISEELSEKAKFVKMKSDIVNAISTKIKERMNKREINTQEQDSGER